eukprot:scaffold9410_cov23-Tisochrysis_lutea.AAC.4
MEFLALNIRAYGIGVRNWPTLCTCTSLEWYIINCICFGASRMFTQRQSTPACPGSYELHSKHCMCRLHTAASEGLQDAPSQRVTGSQMKNKGAFQERVSPTARTTPTLKTCFCASLLRRCVLSASTVYTPYQESSGGPGISCPFGSSSFWPHEVAPREDIPERIPHTFGPTIGCEQWVLQIDPEVR